MTDSAVLTNPTLTVDLKDSRDSTHLSEHPVRTVTTGEEEQISRAQQGDVAAFDWLILQYRDRSMRLASQIMRRPSEAEDVVQEAFLIAFTQIRKFRHGCTFYTWFYRIVVRLCLNRMRTAEWKNSEANATRANEGSVIPCGFAAAPSENRILVDSLMDRLAPALRGALILREVEGLDYEEIAQALEIPVGTVRSRLSAARLQFQTMWLEIQKETQNV